MKISLIASAFIGLMLVSTQANAQQQYCGPRDQIVQRLGERFSEVQTGMGIAGNGTLVELFTNEEGSWTMIITRPDDGISCLLAAGQSWDYFVPEPHVDEDPA